MEKPKTFWQVEWDSCDSPTKYENKEGALGRAHLLAKEERYTVHVFQCTPVASFTPVVEEKSW